MAFRVNLAAVSRSTRNHRRIHLSMSATDINSSFAEQPTSRVGRDRGHGGMRQLAFGRDRIEFPPLLALLLQHCGA
jgi:hypothetical protein